MFIKRLLITDFRNLHYIDLSPSPHFNFICGPNGSGKTSIIEAIHYLALARSFRSNSYQYLITQGQSRFNLYAEVQEDNNVMPTSIGLSRERGQDAVIKINATPISRLLELIDHICVQIIHPQGVELITKEADSRRGFIDWGVYYTDPEFKELWWQYRKILKQRNALLRQEAQAMGGRRVLRQRLKEAAQLQWQQPNWQQHNLQAEPVSAVSSVPSAQSAGRFFDQMSIWDEALASLSERITQKRLKYLDDLQVILSDLLNDFLPHFKLKFELNFGWEKGQDLRAVLAQNLEKDRVLGYTSYGCHRADLKIKNNNLAAGATLSRGQLKMLVYALRLAQGLLLKEQTNRSCIYLIDDLNSELDDHSQRVLLEKLLQCQHQVFISNISTISPDSLQLSADTDTRVFSLQQGAVEQVLTHARVSPKNAP